MNYASQLGHNIGTMLQRWTWRQWAVAACVVVLLWSIGSFVSQWNALHPAGPRVAVAPDAPRAPIAPVKSFADDRRDAVLLVALTVKSAMRDPESFVVEEALVNDSGSVVCLTYRSRNGFGGMNRESVVYAAGKPSQSVATWNKHCAGKILNNLTNAARDISRFDFK